MPEPHPIPVMSTLDFWRRYAHPDIPMESLFREKTDEFLISRLEDTRPFMKVPILPLRQTVNMVFFVTRGSMVRSTDLSRIEIGPGEIHLTLVDQVSSIDALSPDLAGFYCHFSTEATIQLYHKEHMLNELEMINAAMRHSPVRLHEKALANVGSIFERLQEEYHGTFSLALIDAYLVTLCHEIKNAIRPAGPPRKAPKGYELTQQFKQSLLRNIRRQRAVAFYADELRVSPNHLNKVVRQTTGKPASAHIAEMLILEAKVLLKHSDLAISEIAFQLGFVDQSYFSRVFRKQTGQTPSAYRREN